MELGELKGLATIFCAITFFSIVYWAYGPSRKNYFEEAAQLPFEDDDEQETK